MGQPTRDYRSIQQRCSFVTGGTSPNEHYVSSSPSTSHTKTNAGRQTMYRLFSRRLLFLLAVSLNINHVFISQFGITVCYIASIRYFGLSGYSNVSSMYFLNHNPASATRDVRIGSVVGCPN